jgi:hypothetical protein
MEERGELPKQLSKRKKPGVRIAGLSETSILGHPGRFEYSARQSELRFLSGTNSRGLNPSLNTRMYFIVLRKGILFDT